MGRLSSWRSFPALVEEPYHSLPMGFGMGLRELQLQVEYRSDESNLVKEFYEPCLSQCSHYWRAVGFFTSRGLALAGRGLATFIRKGGTMRLVASPRLTDEDYDAIARGYEARADVVQRALLREMEWDTVPLSGRDKTRLEGLAWLIADGRLDIRIAFPRSAKQRGIYHEKVGLFLDETGEIVAFSGSANETAGGLVDNFETVDVFWSWNDPQQRVARKLADFSRLWEDRTEGLEVLPFPRAAADRFREFKPLAPPSVEAGPEPVPVRLRDYQTKAIDAWFAAGCRGILAMATGSGKTITALAAMSRLRARTGRMFAVIACPFQHLVDQWDAECRKFGLRPLLAYQSRTLWERDLHSQALEFALGARDLVAIVATHASLAHPAFTSLIGGIGQDAVLIADEVHHLGTEAHVAALPQPFEARLGLSATPDRWMDEEGSARIRNYFGETVFEYPLDDAIRDGHLTPYRYFVHLVELSDAEMGDYRALTAQIAKAYAKREADDGHRARFEALLRKRALLLNRAENKLERLRLLLQNEEDVRYALFYCAQGQIDEVVRLLGRELNLLVHTFTAREDASTRVALLESFAVGKLQALAAMRCLDEGVDVPATRVAYILASSGNPREFIQRRGRILRRSPGKDSAVIHDLLTVPPPGELDSDNFRIERGIVRRELQRFKEFTSSALNRHQAEDAVFGLARRYHLLDY